MSLKRLLKLPSSANLLLFGPRQVGKSTLLKESLDKNKTLYINLLKEKEFIKYSSNPSKLSEEVEALDKDIIYVVIDEIQRVPELLNEIHYLIEEPKVKRYFYLSGSSARKLKRGQSNLLGGRAWTRHLFPLTYKELGKDFNLARVLRFGTLPVPYLSEDIHSIETLESYVETYLKEEIKAEAIVRNIGTFSRFLKLAANESGNILNFSNIAREASTNNKTIKEYFQILEDTLIGFFLQPYHRSNRERLVKHPKFYLFDTGVRNAVLNNLSSDIEPSTYEYGVIFEQFIINEFVRLNSYYKKNFDFYFYRSSAGAEVDLILETPKNEIYAIEIKSSENPSTSDLRGLYSFKEIYPKANLICLGRNNRARKVNEITIYPWMEFLDLMFKSL